MSELISHFGINWKLLLAQAINFFVLLFVLHRFAYKPVLRMLKERKREIERGIEYKEKAEAELKKMGEVKEAVLQEARGEALQIVSRAESAAKAKKEQIVQEANRKVEGIVADAKRTIEEEKAKMGDAVYHNAEALLRSGIVKVLGKLPKEERDQHLIQEALKELRAAKS